MENVKLLFHTIYHQQEKYPKADSFCCKTASGWKTFNTSEVIENACQVSRALLASGIEPGDKIAIVSNNRPEWNFADLGILQIGAVNVPIYPTISENDYRFIFNDAGIRIAFVSDKDLYQKISNIRADVPTLEAIYTFDKIEGLPHFEDFLAKEGQASQEAVNRLMQQIKEEELATIIYTSGTTGLPKGVMLSHRNVVSNVKATLENFPINHTHRVLSFLPLCHIFERMVVYTYILAGGSVYYAESMETIADNLKEVKPHFFTTVPRLLEKVYDKIVGKGQELTGFKKKLFFWALELGLQYDPSKDQGWSYNFQLKMANKLIFSKWREALGGEIIGIVTGAAALQERLGRVFSAGGIKIREGYGQTESSPVITFNRFEEGGYKFGSVGLPAPGVEVKIGPNQEILARGPNIMMGYYNRPDLTKETVDSDGWLHTGDQGRIDEQGFLFITGRVKELFKTSGGKYVAPQVLENKMKESPFIEQIMVIGENRHFVSALIVPSFIALSEWCMKNSLSPKNNQEMVALPEVQQLIDSEVKALNQNFGNWEQIKKFVLLPDEWTVDSGEMTPTMKVKRKVVSEKYADLIEKIYQG